MPGTGRFPAPAEGQGREAFPAGLRLAFPGVRRRA